MKRGCIPPPSLDRFAFRRTIFFTIVLQLIIGLALREVSDEVTHGLTSTVSWSKGSGALLLHLLMSIVLVVLCVSTTVGGDTDSKLVARWMLLFLVVTGFSGVIVLWIGPPSFTQALHLLAASIVLALGTTLVLSGRTATSK